MAAENSPDLWSVVWAMEKVIRVIIIGHSEGGGSGQRLPTVRDCQKPEGQLVARGEGM